MLYPTKFHINRIIIRWDIAKRRFSIWRPSAILNFRNFGILLSSRLWKYNLHLHTKFCWNLMISGWDIAIILFKMAAVRHLEFSKLGILVMWPVLKRHYGGRPLYWICCDVIVLHPGTLYYAPKIVLNFHLDWFSTFWYTWSFMFHHFGWKLPIQGQIFRLLGVNMGHISIFHSITPKRHIIVPIRVFWAVARQNPSRAFFSTLVREKK